MKEEEEKSSVKDSLANTDDEQYLYHHDIEPEILDQMRRRKDESEALKKIIENVKSTLLGS